MNPSGARQVWLDGRLVPADGPHLNVTDRGFQLGDGFFETLRARRGVVIELDEHLRRLHESADALAIPLPDDDARLVAGIRELLTAEGLDGRGDLDGAARKVPGDPPGVPPGDAALRITVSRGPMEERGLLPAGWRSVTATVAIQAWPYAPPPAAVLASGVRAVASAHRRDPDSPLAGIKSTSRADYVLARLEAARAGADDALFLTIDGRISEATTANLFVVMGADSAGRSLALVTPPLTAAVLPGTTRTWLLADAAALDLGPAVPVRLQAEERDLRPADLLAAREAFLSSSVAGIVPLVAFEGRAIGDGRPGPVTRALREARERWIDEQSRAGAAAMAAADPRSGAASSAIAGSAATGSAVVAGPPGASDR